MQDAIPQDQQKKAIEEIMAVLKQNNMPTTPGIRSAVVSLLKEVSCAHQMKGEK